MVGVIENIEEVSSELEGGAFRDQKILRYGKVDIFVRGTDQIVPALVAKGILSRRGERSLVHPLVRALLESRTRECGSDPLCTFGARRPAHICNVRPGFSIKRRT